MALTFTNAQALRTAANSLLYGAAEASVSLRVKVLPASGASTREWFLIGHAGYQSLYAYPVVGSAGTVRFVAESAPDWDGFADLKATPGHLVWNFSGGVCSLYLNNALIRTAAVGAIADPGSANFLSLGLDTGGFDAGGSAAPQLFTLGECAIRNRPLTEPERVALRDGTATEASIGAAQTLARWTLAGTPGQVAQAGDPGLQDLSGNGHHLATVLGSPVYSAEPFAYTPPARFRDARVAPSREAIVVRVEATAGGDASIRSLGPGLTIRVGGGAPTALPEPVWGIHNPASNPPRAFADWLCFRFDEPIPLGQEITISGADAWVTTLLGQAGSFADRPVSTAALASLLPAFDASDVTMGLGYNLHRVGYDVPFWTYANGARRGSPFNGFGQPINLDARGYPTSGASIQCDSIVNINGSNYWDDKGYKMGPQSGTWTLLTRATTTTAALTPDGNWGDFLTFTLLSDVARPGGGRVMTYNIAVDPTKKHGPALKILLQGAGPGPVYTFDCTELELYPPGIDAANPPKYHPDLLARLAGATCLRNMEGMGTNGSSFVAFSDFIQGDEGLYSYKAERNGYGGTIVSVGPASNADGRYSKGVPVLLTFAAPHGARQGQRIEVATPGETPYPLAGGGAITLNGSFHIADVVSPTQIRFSVGNAIATLAGATSGAGLGSSPIAYGSLPSNFPLGDFYELCGLLGSDAWINVPHAMPDSQVTLLVRQAAQQLPPGKKLRVEYTNEPWNYAPGFLQAGYVQEEGDLLGIGPLHYYVRRAAQVQAVAMAEWLAQGRPAGDLIRGLNTQGGFAAGPSREMLAYAQAESVPVDALWVGPYLNNAPGPATFSDSEHGELASLGALFDAMSIDGLMDASELYVQAKYGFTYVTQQRAELDARGYTGTAIEAYEGGPERGYPATEQADGRLRGGRSRAWGRHPRLRGIILHNLQEYQRLGMRLFCHYLPVYIPAGGDTGSNWSSYNAYGQLPGLGDGSDGLYDNRLDPENHAGLVSVSGGAFGRWAELLSGDEPDPPTPAGVRSLHLVADDGSTVVFQYPYSIA